MLNLVTQKDRWRHCEGNSRLEGSESYLQTYDPKPRCQNWRGAFCGFFDRQGTPRASAWSQESEEWYAFEIKGTIKSNILVKHSGDLPFETILKVARIMRPRSLARKLEGTIKEILGKPILIKFQIKSFNHFRNGSIGWMHY